MTERQRAVVTGGAGGIGAAIAAALRERGDQVVIADLDADRVAATGKEMGVASIAVDVASQEGVAELIAFADQELGGIDLYAANAGVFRGFGLDADAGDWALSWEVNVMSQVRAAQQLVPRWLESGGGIFAVTASAAGLLTQLGSPTYSVSKHASVGFAEWLAATYGERGIQVTCLCPMGVQTAMIEGDGEQDDIPDAVLGRSAVTTAGAVLSPAEVASTLLEAIDNKRFLALPHPEVGAMFAGKAANHDKWLGSMQWFRHQLENQ